MKNGVKLLKSFISQFVICLKCEILIIDTEMNTSRKAMECLIRFSIVNLILGCLLFKKLKKFNESCSLSKAARMSSTYLQ